MTEKIEPYERCVARLVDNGEVRQALEKRKADGKKDNSYVVVNEDEPYAEIVWKLIELWEAKP